MSAQRRKHPYHRAHCFLNRIQDVSISPRLVSLVGWLLTVVMVLGGAFVALAKFADPQEQEFEDPIKPIANWIYSHRFLIVSIFLASQIILQAILAIARRMQRLRTDKLSKVLDNIVTRHFTSQDRARYVYRATLFRVRQAPCVGKWLGIVARSGGLYNKFATIFSIDANNEANNTGVAGECWRREGETIIITETMPDQSAEQLSQENVDKYKVQGWIADEEYSRISVKSIVFLATSIKVEGKIWGILVLDSTDPESKLAENAHKDKETHRLNLEFAALALSLLVT